MLPLLAVSVLLGALGSAVVTGQDSSTPEVPTLWFGSEYGETVVFDRPRYLSTIAPQENSSTERGYVMSGGGNGSATWRGNAAAEPWVLEEGVVVRAHVWVDFPMLVPYPDQPSLTNLSNPNLLTEFRFGVQIMFDRLVLAEGHVAWPYDDLPEGEHALVIDATVRERGEFSNETRQGFMDVRTVTRGARSNVTTAAYVLYGSLEHPSRVEVPGYPWESTNTQEAALVEAYHCLQRSLTGTPCEDPTENGAPNTQRGTVEAVPAAWTLLPAALIATVAVIAAWRARR